MRLGFAAVALAAAVVTARGFRFEYGDSPRHARALMPTEAAIGEFVHSHSYITRRDPASGRVGEDIHVLSSNSPEAQALRRARRAAAAGVPPTMAGMAPSATTQRERLGLLTQIMVRSFPKLDYTISAKYAPIFEAGVPSLYANKTVKTVEEETALRNQYAAIYQQMLAERFANKTDAFVGYAGPNGDHARADELGVACDVYESVTGARVLHFRGSYSDLDFYNIRNLYGYWFFGASRQRYVDVWSKDAGLPLAQEMLDRDSLGQEVQEHIVRMEFNGRMATLPSLIWKGLTEGNVDTAKLGISEQGVADWGQWELTRAITRQEIPAGTAADPARPVYITGYSQGGARAQLASMMLAHEDGVRYNTTTIAATGVQCASQHIFLSPRSLREAFLGVPWEDHSDHIVTYTHVLDPYSAIDYNFGMRCVFGTRDVAASFAAKFCKDIVGYGLGVAGAFHEEALSLCSFITHSSFLNTARLNVTSLGFVNEAGVTDGGCSPMPDMAAQCPAPEAPGSFFAFVLLVIVVPAVVLGLAALACVRACMLAACRRCLCKPPQPTRRIFCGLCVVAEADAVFPYLFCLYNWRPKGELQVKGLCTRPEAEGGAGSGGPLNRCCCCCGRPCCCFGLPCCPGYVRSSVQAPAKSSPGA
ncbi:hypothetical protein FNF31_07623 [Cafeteria roenbergensis]|uniref:Fungal lipase-like domain-containing protein n=1 Tax=Cafeteria roenbergensis TaxID=33653 RepID=A0A5A8C406_CAFRO|nr:hypothetical protein FNF31_07623 [Cafeteria roenbergensis]